MRVELNHYVARFIIIYQLSLFFAIAQHSIELGSRLWKLSSWAGVTVRPRAALMTRRTKKSLPKHGIFLGWKIRPNNEVLDWLGLFSLAQI